METKPIGFWLKTLDRLLDAAFERAFVHEGLSRRHWQTLNILGREALSSSDLAGALRPFLPPDAVEMDGVVQDLTRRGWVAPDGRLCLVLTPHGHAARDRLSRLVGAIREAATAGLSESEYEEAVRVLRHMTTNLEGIPAD